MALPSDDDIRNLPLPDLALRLLKSQGAGPTCFRNLIAGFDNRGFYMVQNVGAPGNTPPADLPVLKQRLADAWAWLEAHALVGPAPDQDASWRQVTTAGRELTDDPDAVTKIWADDRLAGDLDHLLESARTNFALGDYETAAFAAMKAVEVEVRRVAGLGNDLVGVKLMRAAFKPEDKDGNTGPLVDYEGGGGEQQATADLFAGAIGTFKNPASHRTVHFDDPIEAAEVLQLADLLLRMVHRAGHKEGS